MDDLIPALAGSALADRRGDAAVRRRPRLRTLQQPRRRQGEGDRAIVVPVAIVIEPEDAGRRLAQANVAKFVEKIGVGSAIVVLSKEHSVDALDKALARADKVTKHEVDHESAEAVGATAPAMLTPA